MQNEKRPLTLCEKIMNGFAFLLILIGGVFILLQI